jgi:single-stranded DNA-binding protein
MVIGELHTKKYKDKEGVERYTTAVYAKEAHILSTASTKTEESGSPASETPVNADESLGYG